MLTMFRKFMDSSSATKGFVINLAMVVVIVIVTTIFAYGRLNSARSYEKPTSTVEQVNK